MSTVDIAATVAAVALAASRVLSVTQPLWAKLPKWLAVAVPVLVLALPQVASAAGLVKSDVDFVNFCVTAVALLVPGIAAAEEAA